MRTVALCWELGAGFGHAANDIDLHVDGMTFDSETCTTIIYWARQDYSGQDIADELNRIGYGR